MLSRIWLLTFLCLALSPLLCSVAIADADSDASIERSSQEIFSSLMSPFCVARTLNDCPSSAAHDLKNKIREEIKNGKSTQQVLDELYATYGDKIRATPALSGFGLIAWLAPLAFAALGLIIIIWWLSSSRAEPNQVTVQAPPLDPRIEERIKRELQKY